MKRKYTVKSTTWSTVFPDMEPVVCYHGRYWTKWFMAAPVARRFPDGMPRSMPSVAEVVEITPEIDKAIDK